MHSPTLHLLRARTAIPRRYPRMNIDHWTSAVTSIKCEPTNTDVVGGHMEPMRAEISMPAAGAAERLPRSAAVEAILTVDRASTALADVLAQALLAACVVCGLFQVGARFLFNLPSDWSEVLTRFMLIWMVYLGSAVALRHGSMVSVDLMHRLCRGRSRRALEAAITLCVLGFLAAIVGWGVVISWRVRFQLVAGLEVSMSWAYLALPVGACFSIVAVIAHHFDRRSEELETAV